MNAYRRLFLASGIFLLLLLGSAGCGRRPAVTYVPPPGAAASGAASRAYDERGHLTVESRAMGSGATLHTFTTGTTYDAASRVASLTYPSGLVATTSRDAAGRPSGVTQAAPLTPTGA